MNGSMMIDPRHAVGTPHGVSGNQATGIGYQHDQTAIDAGTVAQRWLLHLECGAVSEPDY